MTLHSHARTILSTSGCNKITSPSNSTNSFQQGHKLRWSNQHLLLQLQLIHWSNTQVQLTCLARSSRSDLSNMSTYTHHTSTRLGYEVRVCSNNAWARVLSPCLFSARANLWQSNTMQVWYTSMITYDKSCYIQLFLRALKEHTVVCLFNAFFLMSNRASTFIQWKIFLWPEKSKSIV